MHVFDLYLISGRCLPTANVVHVAHAALVALAAYNYIFSALIIDIMTRAIARLTIKVFFILTSQKFVVKEKIKQKKVFQQNR